MKRKILVTYATRMGSTAEVAVALAEALRDREIQVEVRPTGEVTDLSTYDAVVVGSPIRGGAWLPEAIAFVTGHRDELSRVPTAYFLTCRTLREETSMTREKAGHYLAPLLARVPEVAPRSIGCFAGKIDPGRFSPWMRVAMRLNRTPTGDWRDWADIREWGKSLRSKLRAS